mmetsp:Transcript_7519/g.24515  ORF Transcript_7519/g.24515 Transcript_7519/m.24515 type:complete len:202 (-) Transcript_7519:876-1481(-)
MVGRCSASSPSLPSSPCSMLGMTSGGFALGGGLAAGAAGGVDPVGSSAMDAGLADPGVLLLCGEAPTPGLRSVLRLLSELSDGIVARAILRSTARGVSRYATRRSKGLSPAVPAVSNDDRSRSKVSRSICIAPFGVALSSSNHDALHTCSIVARRSGSICSSCSRSLRTGSEGGVWSEPSLTRLTASQMPQLKALTSWRCS